MAWVNEDLLFRASGWKSCPLVKSTQLSCKGGFEDLVGLFGMFVLDLLNMGLSSIFLFSTKNSRPFL